MSENIIPIIYEESKVKVLNGLKEGYLDYLDLAENMDEGIEILTGVKAGRRDKKGNYPKNALNYLVMERLKMMSESIKESEQKTKRKAKKENKTRK